MPTKRFVLYAETFRNPPTFGPDGMIVPPAPPAILAEAEDVAEATTLGSTTYSGQTALTWVEYDLEQDGVTRCNGRVRDDLPPHGGA